MKIKFYQIPDIVYLENNSWMFQWCCKCKLRHIWNFSIVRDGKKQYIRITGVDDRVGTKLRKFYEKKYKQLAWER